MSSLLQITLEQTKETIKNVQEWGDTIVYTLLAISVLGLAMYFLMSVRRKIIFNAWVNRYDVADEQLGKSIGDLLLFKLRYIKYTHQSSSHKVSLWNTFEDIPSFRQSLDKEMDLLASVKLGSYNNFVAGILTFLFKLIPLFIKPASLNGSINKYGEGRTILQVSLDNYNPRKWLKFENLVWEKEVPDLKKEDIPDVIEEMAYNLYIDLTGGDLFKSWECFKYFTQGLRSYLAYIELRRSKDLEEAESCYDEALKIEPNNAVVCYNKAVLKYYQYRNDLNDEAIKLFGLGMNSTDINLRSRALCGLANAYSQKHGRYKTGKENLETLLEAIDHAEKAAWLTARLDSAYKALAYANHQYGEALAALEDDNSGVHSNPEHRANKHRFLAEKYYKKAYKLNREHYISHNNLANLYLEWGMELPKSPTPDSLLKYWRLRISSFLSQKLVVDRDFLLRKAIQHCERAIEIYPSYHFAHDNLGNAYYQNGNYEKARNSFRNAILYEPTYAEAMNDLAMLYLVKDFREYDAKRAELLHKEALSIIDAKKEKKRKEKLVKAFDERKIECA